MMVPTASILAAAYTSRSRPTKASSPAAPASMAVANGYASAPSSSALTASAAISRACRSPSAPISSGFSMSVPLLAHSSDIHIDEERGAAGLCAVLATARALRADIVLLAGDTFENNQLGATVLGRAGQMLADTGLPIVILPGNHDPALPGSVFVRGGFAQIPNVHILGVTHE